MSGVFQTIDPPLPLHPASLSSPHTKGRGVHTRRAVRGGGSIFRKTPDIGLVSYSIIPLRCSATMSEFAVRTPETIVLRPCKLHSLPVHDNDNRDRGKWNTLFTIHYCTSSMYSSNLSGILYTTAPNISNARIYTDTWQLLTYAGYLKAADVCRIPDGW